MNDDEARREAQREYHRRWRLEHPELHAERQRKWRAKNKAAARAIYKRSRDKASPETKAEHSQAWIDRKTTHNLGWDQVPRRFKRWADWEIEALFDSSLTRLQIAEKIGRSYLAIDKARERYRDRAPLGWFDNKQEASV